MEGGREEGREGKRRDRNRDRDRVMYGDGPRMPRGFWRRAATQLAGGEGGGRSPWLGRS